MDCTKGASGLALISSYSDDESDTEDDSKIDYITTLQTKSVEHYNNINSSKPNNSTNRLPLPSSIVQLYKNASDTNRVPEDNPEQHDGRIRSFPHQRGNWSTYVYIPYSEEEGFSTLLCRLKECAAHMGVAFKVVPEPHVSLTRTVVLLHHWIDNFITSVRSSLGHLPKFTVQLGAPAVYCNEERTRTFLGLRAVTGVTELCATTHALDECLAEFRLPPFYLDPSFHMSVLWVVGDLRATLEPLLPTLQAELETHAVEYPHELRLDVSQCLCKCGNKSFVFPLASL
uniref:U6 snRNA phosphodiesterase n=1 Tax=Homalodisca liturata TaxID=320908 RepID=A0A1B6INN0_9HEMI